MSAEPDTRHTLDQHVGAGYGKACEQPTAVISLNGAAISANGDSASSSALVARAAEEIMQAASSQELSPKQGPHLALKGMRSPPADGSLAGRLLFERPRGSSDSTPAEGSGAADTPIGRRSFDARSFVAERVDCEINERYDIDAREIGVGGYGRVYIAKDRTFKDRTVAIKKLLRQDDQELNALRLEVEIMKVLDHPCICKLFETYVQGARMFFVIEHLEGGDLCDLIMERRFAEEPVAAYIIQQTSSALRYAHAHGIAHRDMKPENVCFCSSNPSNHRIKVIDWGLGKHFTQTRMKSSVGSGAFIAPEVLDPPAADTGYTSACDLWSLGVMAYVTLSGKPPFYGPPVQMLRNMRAQRYPMAGSFWDGVSADAKSYIASLLQSNPEDRLPSEALLTHPWLARQLVEVDDEVLCQILLNVEEFSHAPDFLSICVASVARQLDHRSLDQCYRTFCVLDTNGDGVLQLEEVRAGFVRAFGADGEATDDVDGIFARLDLDGTGQITYTEFCAAGIGESSYNREHVLWAAFKTFDVHDKGVITKENMQQVLSGADVNQAWSKEVCEAMTAQVMEYFGNENGHMDFKDWLSLMHECSSRHMEQSPRPRRNSRMFSADTPLATPDQTPGTSFEGDAS